MNSIDVSKPVIAYIKEEEILAKKEKEGKISYKEIYIPFIDSIAKRMNENKSKYPENNYLNKIDIDDLLDALQRHLNKIRCNYENDTETKEEHLAAIGANAMMILAQINNK